MPRRQAEAQGTFQGSSNLEQQLLQNGLLEVIEADRFDEDVPVAANDVPTIVYVEAFGRLWRENIFGRLDDNRQAVDDHSFRNQCVTNFAKTENALAVIAIAGNVDHLSTACIHLVELFVGEPERSADESVDPNPGTWRI